MVIVGDVQARTEALQISTEFERSSFTHIFILPTLVCFFIKYFDK